MKMIRKVHHSSDSTGLGPLFDFFLYFFAAVSILLWVIMLLFFVSTAVKIITEDMPPGVAGMWGVLLIICVLLGILLTVKKEKRESENQKNTAMENSDPHEQKKEADEVDINKRACGKRTVISTIIEASSIALWFVEISFFLHLAIEKLTGAVIDEPVGIIAIGCIIFQIYIAVRYLFDP